MAKGKNVLTTGDVAKICNVAPRTVSKWFDTGQLKGYRIPGSKDRRIPVTELVRFMKVHNMPLSALPLGKTRVLIVDDDAKGASSLSGELAGKTEYEIRSVGTNFEAGLAAQRFSPHVILVNLFSKTVDADEIVHNIRTTEDLQTIKIIAIANHLGKAEAAALLQKGFDGCVANASDVREVIEKIEDATAIIY